MTQNGYIKSDMSTNIDNIALQSLSWSKTH